MSLSFDKGVDMHSLLPVFFYPIISQKQESDLSQIKTVLGIVQICLNNKGFKNLNKNPLNNDQCFHVIPGERIEVIA